MERDGAPLGGLPPLGAWARRETAPPLILATFLLLLLLASPLTGTAVGSPHGWTLSASDASPHANSGDSTDGPFRLHLWLQCSEDNGLSAAAFSLETPPGVAVVSFATRNGFLNGGSERDLRLAVGGCPSGPVLVGVWVLEGSASGSFCLAPAADTGLVGSVACDEAPPRIRASLQVGYGAGGAPTCDDRPGTCSTIGVQSSGWGPLKALFRD